MPKIANRKFETFNSGILTLCEVKNRSIVSDKLTRVRFGDKTVGAKRFWDAKVSSTVLSKMVAVLPNELYEQDDVVLIGSRQYRIVQIQAKDSYPPSLYLSLESIQTPYKDLRP